MVQRFIWPGSSASLSMPPDDAVGGVAIGRLSSIANDGGKSRSIAEMIQNDSDSATSAVGAQARREACAPLHREVHMGATRAKLGWMD